MPGYDMPYGYPFYGGYAPAYTAQGRHAAFSHHRGVFPRHQPAFHSAFPSHVMPGRHRMR
jgi:hypothetical protein